MTSLAQQIRDLQTTLENIDILANFDQENLELLENIILDESTLMKLAGDDPAGRNLAKYLHRFHKLADQADFQPWPLRKQPDWNEFKEYADNILIIQAEKGWAFYKPVSETQRANTLGSDRLDPLVKKGDVGNNQQDSEFYIAFNNGKIMTDAEIDAEIDKLEAGRTRYGAGTTSPKKSDQFYRQGTRRGGKSATALDKRGANMFDTVKELVGPEIKNVWMARQREDLTTFRDTREQIVKKVISDLGLDPDPSNWSYGETNKVRKALARSGVNLGGGKIGKKVFGPGASIEPAKIAQRRPEEAMKDRERINRRLHKIAPNLFSQARILLKRRGADERTLGNLRDEMNKISTDPETYSWEAIINGAMDIVIRNNQLDRETADSEILSNSTLMQELIKVLRDRIVARYT